MYTLSDFDYHLPPELIAQTPVKPRDHSRLLGLNKKTGEIKLGYFYDLINYLRPGDLLVRNNSKVFPARLLGHKAATGGLVEIFLHQPRTGAGNIWECLIGGRVKVGLIINLTENFTATVLKNNNDGTWQVQFNLIGQKFWRAVYKIGLVPLPPYIKRPKSVAGDKNNYQTVYAASDKVGSVAAPTAGLHFTKSLLKKIKGRGVKIVDITLHVGLGTFATVKTENIKEHKMHRELAEVRAATLRAIWHAKKSGARVIAVGTTSSRALESLNWPKLAQEAERRVTRSGSGLKFADQTFSTDIFIYPGYRFKIVDALITNFHLPKSTLLMLVSALAGKHHIDRAYREAISKKYRFFSYGDAMFIY